jgi:HD-GYP domain-containing protein (c-di-GMP phosphodiesterase class II)
MSETNPVNPHYLDRVIDAAEARPVEASEDIVSRNGTKLVAKGARVDARVRERLLEHKLLKPLETSLTIQGGIDNAALVQVGQEALDRHPLLRSAYVVREGHAPLHVLRDLPLSAPLQSLLTLQARERPGALHHLVAVALLNLSLHLRLGRSASAVLGSAALAGLLHDSGELYIDPQVVKNGSRDFDGWKQLCVHPMLGNKLLMRLPAPDLEAAAAVLEHHERLDGWGYPASVGGEALGLGGRILAVAEVAAQALDDPAPATSTSVALKLIPAEFDRRVVEALLGDGAAVRGEAGSAEAPPFEQTLDQFRAICNAVQGYETRRCGLVNKLEDAPTVFRLARDRYERIVAAFASTGLDVRDPDALIVRLAGDLPADLRLELALVVREVDRRFAELRRQLKLRVSQLAPGHAALASAVLKTSAPMPLAEPD